MRPLTLRRLLVAGGLLVVVVLVVALAGGGSHDRTVHAIFADSAGLEKGDPVRVAGVRVGEVRAIGADARHARADVSLAVRDDVAVSRGARATLRWTTLLGGGMYVDLQPGRGPSATVIGPAQTASQVTFDDLLEPFDGDTPGRLQDLLAGLRQGLGDPRGLRQTLNTLSPTLPTFARGARALQGEEPDDLRALVRTTARTVEGLDRRDRALRDLVGSAAATLETTAGHRSGLGQTLAGTPATLDATRTTVRRLDATLPKLDAIATDLRPGARGLAPALRSARPALRRAAGVLHDAAPLLRSLSPALDHLRSASRSGAPLLDALDPTMQRLNGDLLPFLARRDAETGRRLYEMLGPTVSAADAAGAEYDARGHWLRFAPSGGERAVLASPCQTYFTDPTAAQKVRCDELEQALSTIFGSGTKR